MTENNLNDIPSFFIEKDVLGLEKPKIQNKNKRKKSNRLYILFAFFIVILSIIIFFIDSRDVEYYPNSKKIMKRGNYVKIQDKEGTWTYLQHGKWTYYYQNGEKCAERHFNNGKLDGTNIEWYDNGVIRLKNFYINDSIDGKV